MFRRKSFGTKARGSRSARLRHGSLAVACVVAATTLAACGSGGEGSGGGASLRTLDTYTEKLDGAVTAQILDRCADQSGTSIQRQAVPLDQLLAQVLRQASSRSLPDLVLMDNLYVQRVAATGALSPIGQYGFDKADAYYDSVVNAATYKGKLYGLATAVDTLGLYYNKSMFEEAGLEPPKDWAELEAAAKKLSSGNRYGIAFSAVGNEEGTFQFLPFLWSAGADLTKLDTPEAAKALGLWVRLVQGGSASRSVVNWTQGDVTDQFVAGNAAMMVNGPWALAELREKAGLDFGMIPIPSPEAGRNAEVPLGGEIWTIPVTGDDSQKVAWQVLQCMVQPKPMAEWAEKTAHIAAKPDVAAEADDPTMRAFQEILKSARPRTQVLGANYPEASEAMWTALQAAIIGNASPEQALSEASAKVAEIAQQ